jgi:hypothetical protein
MCHYSITGHNPRVQEGVPISEWGKLSTPQKAGHATDCLIKGPRVTQRGSLQVPCGSMTSKPSTGGKVLEWLVWSWSEPMDQGWQDQLQCMGDVSDTRGVHRRCTIWCTGQNVRTMKRYECPAQCLELWLCSSTGIQSSISAASGWLL